jgi:hypothetical protein
LWRKQATKTTTRSTRVTPPCHHQKKPKTFDFGLFARPYEIVVHCIFAQQKNRDCEPDPQAGALSRGDWV